MNTNWNSEEVKLEMDHWGELDLKDYYIGKNYVSGSIQQWIDGCYNDWPCEIIIKEINGNIKKIACKLKISNYIGHITNIVAVFKPKEQTK